MLKINIARILSVLLFLAVCITVNAQDFTTGKRIVRNYSTMNTPGSEQNWSIVRDKRGIMYFGSQDKGVITYDGHSWRKIDIRNNTPVQSLATDYRGYIYVGAASDFGYILPRHDGNLVYKSLLPKLDSAERNQMGVVFKILVDNNRVIYSTPKRFYLYYPEQDSLKILDHSELQRNVNLIWNVNGKIIVADNAAGLFELRDDELVAMEGGEKFAYTYVRSLIPGKEEGDLIIGTYNKGMLVYNYNTGEVSSSFVDPEINDELKEYKLYKGVRISEKTFAVSTTAYGVYIFDMDGNLIEQINTSTSDLKDNAVTSVYYDENNGFPVLWISNWGYLSKVYLGLPYKVLNIEEWFNNALNELTVYKGDLYLSNDAGVIKSYETEEGLGFEKLKGFTDQTFPLLNFSYGTADFLLIGTISGTYSYNGSYVSMIEQDGQPRNVRSLCQLKSKPGIVVVGLNKGGLRFIEYKNGRFRFLDKDISYVDEEKQVSVNSQVSDIIEDKKGRLWFKTDDPENLYRVDYNREDTVVTEIGTEHGLDDSPVMLKEIDDDLLVTTTTEVKKYDYESDRFITDSSYFDESLPSGIKVLDIYKDPEGGTWVNTLEPRNLLYYIPGDDSREDLVYKPFYLMPNTITYDMGYFRGHVWLMKSKELYILNKEDLYHDYTSFNTLVRRVIISGDSTIFNGAFYTEKDDNRLLSSTFQTPGNIPDIDYNNNDLSFFFSSPYYLEEDSVRFSYKLEGFDSEWSRWDYVNYRDYTNIPHGRYKFKVRSKNIIGEEGNLAEFEFEILRPWYLTYVALLAYLLIAVLLVYVIIKLYTRRLINENIRLEGIVAERTKEVVRQKEELEASIHYASRIQRAILPTEGSLQGKVEDYFILFKPRDIVSGDFYWVSEKGPRLFVVAADCTGHGVPGAFMSILGISFLDEIINKSGYTDTDDILNALRTHVTESLKQMGEDEEETKDGMDMGLLVINNNDESIEFSGAYNPCWKVRKLTAGEKEKFLDDKLELKRGELSNGEYILETLDADRMPIGISSRMGQSFTMHKQKLEKGATYYLFSDGYSDQFGGDYGRKFLKKNLKKLILEIQDVPVKQQKDLLDKRLLDWMGEAEQVDDILVMGIRISS